MAYIAPVVDGVLQQKTETTSETTKKSGAELDKDAFLQLLVAEMKYQDPLEASNNSTEYISQLATFSELEGMQNLQNSAEDIKATDLIGKTVILDVDNNYVYGQVDFVQYESGKSMLNVNGSLYSMDNLYQVIDAEYLSAYTKASELVSDIAKLPTAPNLSLENREAIEALRSTYDAMNDYEKSFVADEVIETLETLEEKMEELKTIAGITDTPETEDESESDEEVDDVTDTTDTEETDSES